MRMTRAGMRFRCSVLLLMPPAIVWAVPLVGGDRGGPLEPWSSLVDGVFVAAALFMLGAPFTVPLFMRGSREKLEAIGVDLDQLTLLMGTGGSASASAIALLFSTLLGSRIAYPYPWAALSFLGVAFWCWRLRHLLR